jgi:hypothetical protein
MLLLCLDGIILFYLGSIGHPFLSLATVEWDDLSLAMVDTQIVMMYWLDGAARSNVASRMRTANPILDTVQYATDWRLLSDVLATSVAKSRFCCHLKKTVKCWAVNWIKETNQQELSVWPSIFLKHKYFRFVLSWIDKAFSRTHYDRTIYKPRYTKAAISRG